MIRQANVADIDALDALSVRTIQAMHKRGVNQWTTAYPRAPHFKEDIQSDRLFVHEQEGRILGVYAFCTDDEPAYRAVRWHGSSSPIIHRLLVDPSSWGRGVADELLVHAACRAASSGAGTLRTDTHPANGPMRRLLRRHQFERRGYLAGIHRDAYERSLNADGLRRILILGASGSGKTTLARRLGKRLNQPVLHLDTVYWLRNWTAMEPEAFQRKLQSYMRRHPRFVMDGNYLHNPSFEDRLRFADTVILLKYERSVALKGIIERERRYKHTYRSDMATGCIEGIDQDFLKYVAFFEPQRKLIEARLRPLQNKKRVLEFDTPRDLELWLRTIGCEPTCSSTT